MALHEDREGALWVGTWDGGLNRLDPETGDFTSYRNDPADPTSLGNDRVSAIAQDRQGKLWVATYGGLNRLEDETGSFTRFQNDADPTASAITPYLISFQDQQGLLWIGTFEAPGFYDRCASRSAAMLSDPNPNSASDRHPGVLKDSLGSFGPEHGRVGPHRGRAGHPLPA
jgi:ligand-binding sensor domain-containing protein